MLLRRMLHSFLESGNNWRGKYKFLQLSASMVPFPERQRHRYPRSPSQHINPFVSILCLNCHNAFAQVTCRYFPSPRRTSTLSSYYARSSRLRYNLRLQLLFQRPSQRGLSRGLLVLPRWHDGRWLKVSRKL